MVALAALCAGCSNAHRDVFSYVDSSEKAIDFGSIGEVLHREHFGSKGMGDPPTLELIISGVGSAEAADIKALANSFIPVGKEYYEKDVGSDSRQGMLVLIMNPIKAGATIKLHNGKQLVVPDGGVRVDIYDETELE